MWLNFRGVCCPLWQCELSVTGPQVWPCHGDWGRWQEGQHVGCGQAQLHHGELTMCHLDQLILVSWGDLKVGWRWFQLALNVDVKMWGWEGQGYRELDRGESRLIPQFLKIPETNVILDGRSKLCEMIHLSTCTVKVHLHSKSTTIHI